MLSFRGGTLTAQVNGTAGTTGPFTARLTGITGSGLAAGVTADVTIIGNESLTTGSFTETVTGAPCRG